MLYVYIIKNKHIITLFGNWNSKAKLLVEWSNDGSLRNGYGIRLFDVVPFDCDNLFTMFILKNEIVQIVR